MDELKADQRDRLAPIVGAMPGKKLINKLIHQDYDFWGSSRLLALAKASKKAGVAFYLFCPNDLDKQANQVVGTYYDTEREAWTQKKFPIPDVLYDRLDASVGVDVRTHLLDRGREAAQCFTGI